MKFRSTVVRITLLGMSLMAPFQANALGYGPPQQQYGSMPGQLAPSGRLGSVNTAVSGAPSAIVARLEAEKRDFEEQLERIKADDLDEDLFPSGVGACHLSCVSACGSKSDVKVISERLLVSDLREDVSSLCLKIDEVGLSKEVSTTCQAAVKRCGPIKARSEKRRLENEIKSLKAQIEAEKTRASEDRAAELEQKRYDLAKYSICPWCDKAFREPTGGEQAASIISALTPLGLGAMNMGMYAIGQNAYNQNYQGYLSNQMTVGAPAEMPAFWAGNVGVPYASYGGFGNGFGNGFGGGFNPLASILGNGVGINAYVNAGIGMPGMWGYPGLPMGQGSCFPSYPNGSMIGGYNPYGNMIGGGITIGGGMGNPFGGYNPYGNMIGGYNPYGNMIGGYNPYGNMIGGGITIGGGMGNPFGGYNPYGGMIGGYNPYGNMIGGGLTGNIGGIGGGMGGFDSSYWQMQQQRQQQQMAMMQAQMQEQMQRLQRQQQAQQSMMNAQTQYQEALQRLQTAYMNAQSSGYSSGFGPADGGMGMIGGGLPVTGPTPMVGGGLSAGFSAGFSLN